MITDLIKYIRDKSLAEQSYNEELLWIKDYYQSEGFLERLNKLPKYYNEWYLNELKNYTPQEYDTVEEFNYELPEDPKFKRSMFQGSHYRPHTETITIGLEPRKDYNRVAAHELGHHYSEGTFFRDVDGYKQRFYHYNYYPVFRENPKYKEAMNKMETPADKHRFFIDPDLFYEKVHHDALPGESYADLVEFRSTLSKNNIYDSRKASNIFTLEHLNKARDSGIKSRLFDYYNDDQIIWMMNEVAYNPTQKPVYAKNGIVIKKRFK